MSFNRHPHPMDFRREHDYYRAVDCWQHEQRRIEGGFRRDAFTGNGIGTQVLSTAPGALNCAVDVSDLADVEIHHAYMNEKLLLV